MGLGKNAIGSCSRSRMVTPPEGRLPVGTNLPESHRRPPRFARRCRWIENAFCDGIGLVGSEKPFGACSRVTANSDLPKPSVACIGGLFRCKYSAIRSPYAPFSIMGCTPKHDVFLRVYLFTMALSTGPASQKDTRELGDKTADGSASKTIPRWHFSAAVFL